MTKPTTKQSAEQSTEKPAKKSNLRTALINCAIAINSGSIPKSLKVSITSRFVAVCSSDDGMFDDGSETSLITSLNDLTKQISQISELVKSGVIQ